MGSTKRNSTTHDALKKPSQAAEARPPSKKLKLPLDDEATEESRLDDLKSCLVERPDGFYWQEELSAKLYGPFPTLMDIGTGYVGLVTGVGLASRNHRVICIDIDQDRVNQINNGQSPFYDDTLPEALDAQVNRTGNLKASTDYHNVSASEVTFICVSTSRNNGSNTDFTAIESSAKAVGEALRNRRDYHLVVTKSSVPPGATEDIIRPLLQEHSGKLAGAHFGMAVNPEFLQEGRALESFLNSDRISAPVR